MDRLTEKTIGCFEYDLKDHEHVIGEFSTYDAFYAYSMAVKRLGQYEDTGLTPEEIAGLQEEALDVRPEVKWFAGEMEKQLGANEHKGGWQDCDSSFLLEELHKNYDELFWLTLDDPLEDICRRAANIANFAMMVADNVKKALEVGK